ncbi:hypothetical protein P7M39_24565, partial [Vibrio parahaemolyticus]|nr:hypothetical protein [Vibrio parahaemolyticus]
FCGEIFENGGEINGSAGAKAARVTAFLQVPGDAADGELEASFDGFGNGLLPVTSSSSSAFGWAFHCCSEKKQNCFLAFPPKQTVSLVSRIS